MFGMTSPELVEALARLLAPGIIIVFMISRFEGRTRPATDNPILKVTVIAVLYRIVVHPIFSAGYVILPSWLWGLLYYIAVPLLTGLAFVLLTQRGFQYLLAESFGVDLSHHQPTAWEHAFRGRSDCYVIVRLRDGTDIMGSWTAGSFASSDEGQRDVLLSQLYRLDKNKKWELVEPSRSILICAGEISHIEFI